MQNGRTPVSLPFGYYSTSIVQITPFNIKFDPGAKLIFPNTDNFPPGTPLGELRPALQKALRDYAAGQGVIPAETPEAPEAPVDLGAYRRRRTG